MKRCLFIIVLLTSLLEAFGAGRKEYAPLLPSLDAAVPYSVAHRGCHIDGLIPENCPAGVAYARRYGFRAIECDAHYTKDSVLVLMHDATINRTMRLREGYAVIPEPIRYADVTYQELCDRYVLASDEPAFRTCIPTLEEELLECRRQGIIPMLHTDIFEAYAMAQRIVGDNFIAFDGNYTAVREARSLGNCLILWDPGTRSPNEIIHMLEAIGGRCGISSMKRDLLTPDFIRALTSHGYHVQSSIFPTPYEMQAIHDGATLILSDFCLLPYARHGHRTARLQKKNFCLHPGDTLLWTAPTAEHASMLMEVQFTGSLEVIVDGQRKYKMENPSEDTWIDGWRHFNADPATILLRATAPTTIRRLRLHSRRF